MIRIKAPKLRDSILRGFFVLGAVFFLVKGQSGFCATPGCSGDPVAAAVELVLRDPPDYGFHYQPHFALTPEYETAFAVSAAGLSSGVANLSAAYDHYARAVLKSNDHVFIFRSCISFIRKTIPHSSPDGDPPPAC